MATSGGAAAGPAIAVQALPDVLTFSKNVSSSSGALPTSLPPIGASGSSSWPTGRKRERCLLLPTPVASDGSGGQPVAKRKAGGHQVDLSDLVITLFPDV